MATKVKISLVISAIFLCYGGSFSQGQPDHEMKTVVGEDGKIYWNKNLPVYISLSSTPDANSGHILKESESKESDPIYFDTEGTNWIRTRWAVDKETGKTIYPKEEVLWPVEADGLPPVTNAKFIASGKHVVKGTTYYSGDLKVQLFAADATSGVEKIYYSTGENFIVYNSEIPINVEKEWDLKFYALDKVGNAEVLRDAKEGNGSNQFKFSVDATAPSTTYKVIDPIFENNLSPVSKIELTSEDTGSGVYKILYSIDKGTEKLYEGKISLYGLSDGDHSVSFYATDQVGNKEEFKNYTFYLDKIAPEIQFSVNGDQYASPAGNLYISDRSALNLIATDNRSGVESVQYKIDGDTYSDFQTALKPDKSAGPHTIYYFGKDKVNNTSSVKSNKFYIDNKAPVVKFSTSGPKYVRKDTLFVRTITSFTISPYESGDYQSGIKSISYTINEGIVNEYTEPFTIAGEGLKNLSLDSKDQVENSSSLKQIVFVDNTAPEIIYNFSVEKIGTKTVREKDFIIFPPEVQVYLAATDKHVGTSKIYYSINGSAEKLYAEPIKYFKAGSNIEIKVRALDQLGNESIHLVEFSVE
ncbi:MAG: hypothetical protein OEY34_09115 [Cyclobacteriaceae bacterium]|nr:hypothetical protein [Cyclobacteriaceae bacterium]